MVIDGEATALQGAVGTTPCRRRDSESPSRVTARAYESNNGTVFSGGALNLHDLNLVFKLVKFGIAGQSYLSPCIA